MKIITRICKIICWNPKPIIIQNFRWSDKNFKRIIISARNAEYIELMECIFEFSSDLSPSKFSLRLSQSKDSKKLLYWNYNKKAKEPYEVTLKTICKSGLINSLDIIRLGPVQYSALPLKSLEKSKDFNKTKLLPILQSHPL